MNYFFSIFFGTFVLEDVALVSSITLVNGGKLELLPAFFAAFLGITVGDLALYFLGLALGSWQFIDRFEFVQKLRTKLASEKHSDLLTYSIVASRFIPGTRLPTYLTAGLLKYPLLRFTALTIVTVFAWVLLAFGLGKSIQPILSHHWILTLAVLFLGLKLIKFLFATLSDEWQRRAFFPAWRKWAYFEFWPAWLFYLPVVPYYLLLSIRYRSFLLPFYANPGIENGGLIGESKWDFLQHLNSDDASTLKAVKIGVRGFAEVKKLLEAKNFVYPFVMKPDVGQRGFAVRIVRSDSDLKTYLANADFDVIAQRLSTLTHEAGLLYVRKPSESAASIVSITDKRFPTVTGDGVLRLGDLILRDERASMIAEVYFSRHREKLAWVPAVNEVVALSECGNHCQGAIFLNGKELQSAALEDALHRIALQIPQFYFGRFDIRYQDKESLRQGRGFEIIEINGAGSEATHIWDRSTRLADAYRSLFAQWRALFEIGNEVKLLKSREDRKIQLSIFFGACLKVLLRKNPLSVSS